MRVIFIALVCGLIVNACAALNRKIGLVDDNFIEESIEEKIKEKLYIDIDLTPASKE